jgi:hypothetical protein
MPFQLREIEGTRIVISPGPGKLIRSTEDALDTLSFGGEHGSNRFIFLESNFPPEFYDLKTGLAGEILQKFSTYRIRAAVVGTFEQVTSKRFREFMVECNRGQQLHFLTTTEQALDWLSHIR